MRRATLLLSVLLLGSCQSSDPVSCPPYGELRSGTYQSDGRGRWQGGPGQPLPHDDHQPKVLRLDRADGRLRVTYQRNGQEVVETWRVVPRSGGDASAD